MGKQTHQKLPLKTDQYSLDGNTMALRLNPFCRKGRKEESVITKNAYPLNLDTPAYSPIVLSAFAFVLSAIVLTGCAFTVFAAFAFAIIVLRWML